MSYFNYLNPIIEFTQQCYHGASVRGGSGADGAFEGHITVYKKFHYELHMQYKLS